MQLTIRCFQGHLNSLAESLEEKEFRDFFDDVINKTGYMQYLELDKETAEDRKANVMELLANLLRYMEENEDGTLTGFLEEVALMTDIDNYNADNDSVVMMTLHSAKGLEFPFVFIVGMEEGLFPGNQVMYDPSEVEEERRLCYVGITRAKQKLYITNARTRMIYGNTSITRPSRFVAEIPEELVDSNLNSSQQTFYGGFSSQSGYSSGYSGGSGNRQPQSTFGDTRQGVRKPANVSQGFSRGGFSKSTEVKKSAPVNLDYKLGDTVEHKTFGQGLILSANSVGGDMVLEIAFDSCGTKKIMAKMAKLKKL